LHPLSTSNAYVYILADESSNNNFFTQSPLGGRSFESFSEDPTLSGLLASAYVNGCQSGGIGVTIKHYVYAALKAFSLLFWLFLGSGNDKENDRQAYDSIISQRALREIYLMPFMLAQKYSKPWSVMTAYVLLLL
jgi:beta-glucosidase